VPAGKMGLSVVSYNIGQPCFKNDDIGNRSHITLHASTATCDISSPSDKESLSGKKRYKLPDRQLTLRISLPLVFYFCGSMN
jgi:hypothetical protein